MFDIKAGIAAKEEGKAKARVGRSSLLQEARDTAFKLARYSDDGKVSADEVAAHLQSMGLDYRLLGNAAGSIFKGNQWVATGEYVKSRRVSAHAREIKVWKLAPQRRSA